MKRTFATLGVAGLALLSVTAPAYANEKFDICHDGKVLNIDQHALEGQGHAGHPGDIIPPEALPPRGLNWTPRGLDACGVAVIPPPVVVVPPGDDHPGGEDETEAEDETTPDVEDETEAEDDTTPDVEDETEAEHETTPDVEDTTEEEDDTTPGEEETSTEVDQPTVVPDATVVPEATVTLTPAAQTPAPLVAAPKGAALKDAAPNDAVAKDAVAKAPAAAGSRGTNQGFNAQTAVGGSDESTAWLAGLGVLLGAGAVVAVRRTSRTEPPTAG